MQQVIYICQLLHCVRVGLSTIERSSDVRRPDEYQGVCMPRVGVKGLQRKMIQIISEKTTQKRTDRSAMAAPLPGRRAIGEPKTSQEHSQFFFNLAQNPKTHLGAIAGHLAQNFSEVDSCSPCICIYTAVMKALQG